MGCVFAAGAPPDLNEAREALRRIVRDGNRASDATARIRALLKKGETERMRLDVNQVIQEMVELARERHASAQRFGANRTLVLVVSTLLLMWLPLTLDA